VERARHKEVVALLSRSKPYVQLEVERYPITPTIDYPEVFDPANEPEQFSARRRSTLRSSISNQSEMGSPWQHQKYFKVNFSILKNR
jgi:hypothetical protein